MFFSMFKAELKVSFYCIWSLIQQSTEAVTLNTTNSREYCRNTNTSKFFVLFRIL